MWHCQLFYAIPILRWGSWFWVAIASRQYHGSLCRRVVQQQQVGELKLAFDTDSNSITTEGYAVFTHVSCNTSSVSNTYHSNHQIGKLSNESNEHLLPENLISLLQLNIENIESQAARLKIIASHFSGREIKSSSAFRGHGLESPSSCHRLDGQRRQFVTMFKLRSIVAWKGWKQRQMWMVS